MKGKINKDSSDFNISLDVIATIAGSSCVECAGVIGMAEVNLARGISRLLKKESLRKGIDVILREDGSLELVVHIIVAYGVNIAAVATNLTENVSYRVRSQTGFKVSHISVRVEGVRRID